MTTRKPPPSHPQPSPSKPSPNVATMQAKLRAETITLLKLDATKLDAADEIMIARAGALRLIVSDLEASALHGDRITVSAYVEASTELEKLVRGVGHVAVNADGAPEALASARAKMAALMGVILNETPSEEEARRSAELAALHKRIAELERQLAERLPQSEAPSPPRSETPPPPPASDNVVPIREQLAVSPLVVSDARSFLDSINRRAW